MCVCAVTITWCGDWRILQYKSNTLCCLIWCTFFTLLITSSIGMLTFAILYCSNRLCCLIFHGCGFLYLPVVCSHVLHSPIVPLSCGAQPAVVMAICVVCGSNVDTAATHMAKVFLREQSHFCCTHKKHNV